MAEPNAWLVTDGKMFHDRVFIGRETASASAISRADGSKVEPLYTSATITALQSELRDVRERLARVSALASDLAGDVEQAAKERWSSRDEYPSQQAKFDLDVSQVRELRAILDGEAK